MKKALISPSELLSAGLLRIAQVSSEEFPVAEPLFWIDVEDDVTSEEHGFDPETDAVVHVPREEVQVDLELVKMLFISQIQLRLDNFAKAKGYDGILSACTYATSKIEKFATEGQLAVDKRDETWVAAYAILAQVQAGSQPMPVSLADIEADLPTLEWPNA